MKHLTVILALAVALGAASAPAAGQSTDNRAPEFALPDASGNDISLSDFLGKIVVVNFWATWCAPCRYEIPAFIRLQKRYADDVQFIGISVDEEGWPVINRFADEMGVNYPIVWDEGSVTLDRYGDPSALPTTFLIDPEGTLSVIIQGMVTENDLAEILDMMIQGDAI